MGPWMKLISVEASRYLDLVQDVGEVNRTVCRSVVFHKKIVEHDNCWLTLYTETYCLFLYTHLY